MFIAPLHDQNQTLPPLMGHATGFVDTAAECDAVISALNIIGVPSNKIFVLHGPEGLQLFHRLMEGSMWGELAEDLMKDGERELKDGHFVLCIDAAEREEGLRIATEAKLNGGHGFDHFGLLVDEGLTR